MPQDMTLFPLQALQWKAYGHAIQLAGFLIQSLYCGPQNRFKFRGRHVPVEQAKCFGQSIHHFPADLSGLISGGVITRKPKPAIDPAVVSSAVRIDTSRLVLTIFSLKMVMRPPDATDEENIPLFSN